MNGLLADCLHGVRLYVRTPVASVIAITVLAVASAFVAAFFSMYVDLILRADPGFEASNRIATIGQNDGRQLIGVPLGIIERIAKEVTSIEAVAATARASHLIGPERERAYIEMVSEPFFRGLRPHLALGRGFLPEEHAADAEHVAVISYAYWQERFGADPDILGTLLQITRDPRYAFLESDGRPGTPEVEAAEFRIVGVMSEELPGLAVPVGESALWMPLEHARPLFSGPGAISSQHTFRAYVRLVPGVSSEALARELNERYGDEISQGFRPGMRLDAIDGVVYDINVQRDAKRQLQLLLAGGVLLALVAAGNASLFLLARAPGRRRELGIRMAVGASIKRLTRQLVSEAAVLVAVSAALGVVLTIWLIPFLQNLAFLSQAEWRDVSVLDWRVLSVFGAFLLLMTALVSLAPVAGLQRQGIATGISQVAARASIAQRLIGNGQILMASALGAAGLAFGWYLASLMLAYPGYETADRYMVDYRATGDISVESPEYARVALARRREAIEAIPGVTAVAFGQPVPGAPQDGTGSRITDPNDPANEIVVRMGGLDSRFIDVLGLTVIHGRQPEDSGTTVAVVNQALARAIWGREDVVGESLPVRGGVEIIGVLEDLSFEHPSAAVQPLIFLSSINPFGGKAVIESGLSAAELRRELDAIVSSGDVEIQIDNVRPLRQLRSDLIAADRARGLSTIAATTLAVLLTAFGFYGIQRYLVTQGLREYAIRAAVGAGPRGLSRLVFVRGLAMSLPGLAVGAMLSFIVVAWLRGDFVSRDISPFVISVAVTAGLAVLLVAASLGPARLARLSQPAALLREE